MLFHIKALHIAKLHLGNCLLFRSNVKDKIPSISPGVFERQVTNEEISISIQYNLLLTNDIVTSYLQLIISNCKLVLDLMVYGVFSIT